MLNYAFMQRAMIIGVLLGFIIPLMGVIVVNRRTSTIGDALSHSSLAGIGFGLLLGLSPLVGSIVVTILGAFAIELVRYRFPKSGDLATAMVMSIGIGLASVLSDVVPTTMKFETYLFGSIVTIRPEEMWISIAISFVVLVLFFTLYYPLLYVSVDSHGARLTGLPIRRMDNLFTAILAIAIAMAARTIGALMVSSLMILPVATALLFAKSYRQAVFSSMLSGVIMVTCGLTASYYLGWKPGGTIVLLGIVGFLIALIVQKILRLRGRGSYALLKSDPIEDEKAFSCEEISRSSDCE